MLFVPEPGCSESQFIAQLGSILAYHILEFDVLEVAPDVFIRIQIGRIRGQSFEVQALLGLCQNVFDRLTAVNGGAVPNNQQFAWNVTQYVLKKDDDLGATDTLLMHLHQQLTTWCDGADDRQPRITARRTQKWCLADWCIGTHDGRQQVEAGFVDPDYGSVLAFGFFLISGQTSVRQRLTARSSR